MRDQALPQLSLIIPARNEAHRLPDSLGKIRVFLEKWPVATEVILWIERSDDGTLELARQAVAEDGRFRVFGAQTANGKGYAVRQGMLRARGEVRLFMDADLSVPLEFVAKSWDFLQEQPTIDVLCGSRRVPGSRILKPQPFLRAWCGRFFNLLIRCTGCTHMHDTQCGFKAFRQPAAEAVFSKATSNGFAFDVEILLLAEKMGFEIHEFPVDWYDAPGTRLRAVRDGLRAFWDAWVSVQRVKKSINQG